MASITWSRWWLLTVLLLMSSPPKSDCRNVTNEDIRDAMLSLIHMFRTSEDKLERHEYREKSLGDQLKKSLFGLEKKHRALEPLKGMISRLDERLSNVETILLQKEEREKATQKKTSEMLEAIQNSLASLTSDRAGRLPADTNVENNLTFNDDGVARIETKLDSVKQEVESLKKSFSKESLRAMCLDVASDVNPLEKHISEAEKLLNKYELKLNEYNGNSSKVQTDFVPLSEVSLADEAWHSKMSEVMERQAEEIKKIRHLLSDAESMWKDLPRLADLKTLSNETMRAIQDAKENIKENDERSLNKVTTKLREMSDRLGATNEDIQRSLTEGNTMSEKTYSDISKNYEILKNEVQTLTKNENIMIQTADNVIATKKKIEYSVHQILLEVGELIKTQSSNLNKTINNRMDHIESTILESQTGALTNVSSKIESEMSQVWRQIGIMYQQLTASKMSLDKLANQTEQYVNTSASTMDNVEGEIGMITERISDLNLNLNHILGRLSVITHEFNNIKAGLGDALDNVKNNFQSLKTKLDDAGPGPHNITNAET